MCFWHRVYHHILRWMVKCWVHARQIPTAVSVRSNIDLTRPILYLLPCRSQLDLLVLQHYCEQQALPDPLQSEKIGGFDLPRTLFIDDHSSGNSLEQKNSALIKHFQHYLNLQHTLATPKIQLLPIALFWGRAPGYSFFKPVSQSLHWMSLLRQIFTPLLYGRDAFIHFSHPVALHSIAEQYSADPAIIQKLIRVARMHFARQCLMITGPRVLERSQLIDNVLQSDAIQKIVGNDWHNKKEERATTFRIVVKLFKEISANFNYHFIRCADRFFSWLWHRLYQGITVHHVEQVRQIAQAGHEIVYVPCHRSHMDYLLLSYVLYHQGLVPPHIAAGINLDFWPVGFLFRRMGAFFIRRSFKGNKLYSTVLREYLAQLFTQGCSIEYFIEGGRSRTGHLLAPKIGLLTMTLQVIMRGVQRPITLVPVYIGYEHVIEEETYAKERLGATKERESFWQVLRTVTALRNLGQGYVNFGEPILLQDYLDRQHPNWRCSLPETNPHRSNRFTSIVDQLAHTIMININSAAAVNAINLCISALLAVPEGQLTHAQLAEQIGCYLRLLHHLPFLPHCTVPEHSPEVIIKQAVRIKNLRHQQNEQGEVVIGLTVLQRRLLTYYSHNIQHLLILPALVATVLIHQHPLCEERLCKQVVLFYPLLQAEFFMHYSMEHLPQVVHAVLQALLSQKLVVCIEERSLFDVNVLRIDVLKRLAATADLPLLRYTVLLSLLCSKPQHSRRELEQQSRTLLQKLVEQKKGNFSVTEQQSASRSELFDKKLFSTLFSTVRAQQALDAQCETADKRINYLQEIALRMMPSEVQSTIKASLSL